MDTGSMLSYISPQLRDKLRLKAMDTKRVSIKTFGEHSESKVCDRVKLYLHTNNGQLVELICLVAEICHPLNSQIIDVAAQKYAHLSNLKLADSNAKNEPLNIDILIGSDFYWSIVNGQVIKGVSGPVAISSKIGYILNGPVHSERSDEVSVFQTHVMRVQTEQIPDIKEVNKNFWNIEATGVDKNNFENNRVIENFSSEIKFENGRYDVKLPFKENFEVIEDNYAISKQRLKNLWKKLRVDENLLSEYDNIINDQLENNIIEPVKNDSYEVGKTTYLPHRPVIKDDRSTSKVRVVFDASASNQGPSLNQCLYPRPSLTTKLFSVLLRFRSYNYAVVADIKQAFLQINLNESHRNYVRFLWFKDISKLDFEKFENCELAEYRFCRVIFGVTSSPFLLTATINFHFAQYDEVELVENILRSVHVDDFTGGSDSLEDSYNLFKECKQKLADGGFMLRKFQSNSDKLEHVVYRNHPDAKPEVIPDQNKVLGLIWNKSEDEIVFDIQSFVKEFNTTPTERLVSHALASLFDPLGLLNPVIVKLKILFQDICISNVSWDTQLDDDEFIREWHSIIDDLNSVPSVVIDRKFCIREISDPFISIQLHVFCDASKRAHGACVYLRFMKQSGYIKVCLVTSKSKVNPVMKSVKKAAKSSKNIMCDQCKKKVSVPKLELRGAVLASNLTENVVCELGYNYDFEHVFIWTDSSCVYCWILNTDHLYKKFIQDRLDIIRKLDVIWKLVPSKMNPADISSKGCGIGDLLNNNKNRKLWFEGPEFLSQPEKFWPAIRPGDKFDDLKINAPCLFSGAMCENIKTPCLSAGVESHLINAPCLSAGAVCDYISKVPCLSAGTEEEKLTLLSNIIDIEKFSSLNKLLRVTAYVVKFITNLKIAGEINRREEKIDININKKCFNLLEAKDIQHVKTMWIKEVQMNVENESNYGQLKKALNLYKDDEEIIRCQGRLDFAPDITFEENNPIFLPKKHYFTYLVIRHSHVSVGHCLTKQTLNHLRKQYWIPKARNFIRNIIKACQTCKLKEEQSYGYPNPPPLPKPRVTISPAFKHIGIDYTGPVHLRNVYFERDNSLYKAWIALITCSNSRAIYLDIATDNSSLKCVNVLTRFYNRRGAPKDIQSDNGSNFVGEEVQNFVASRNTNWNFNTPSAPWTGGFFERMVKSVKRILKKLLGNSKVTYDEMLTILSSVENILNKRPLTYQYEELDEIITPNHLIYGRSINDTYKQNSNVKEVDNDKRAKYIQTLLNHFWKRWNDEYLKELREYNYSNNRKRSEPKINDVVLVEEDKVRRNKWRFGKVIEVIKSKDGEIRSAIVQTHTEKGTLSELKRPVNKLYPLVPRDKHERQEPAVTFIDEATVPKVFSGVSR